MNLDPRRGLTDTRVLKALPMANGDAVGAVAFAAGQAWGDTPRVREVLMTAVSGMGTGSDGAGLVGAVGTDLLGVIRPLTIVGKMQNLQRVPFDTSVRTTVTGSGANWVGQGAPAPLTRPTYSTVVTLSRLKVVALAVVSEDLVKSSAPGAEATLSKDFIDAAVACSDLGFIDPASGAVAGVWPASVTNGAPSFAASGTSLAQIDGDLGRLMDSLISRGSTLQYAYWILDPLALSFLARVRGSGGNLAYPGLSMTTGGTLLSLPVIVSGTTPNVGSPQSSSISLIDSSRIWIAKDPEMAFDVSRAAAVQMLDNPTNDSQVPTPTTQVSMFQTGSAALRGTRFMNWRVAEAGCAAVLNNAQY